MSNERLESGLLPSGAHDAHASVPVVPSDEPARLELSAEAMRAMGYQVIDQLVERFVKLPEKPATRIVPRPVLKEKLSAPPPEEPEPWGRILQQTQDDVMTAVGLTTHPRFAFVPSPSNFVSVMADCLAAGFNIFGGNWLEGAGPCQVERTVIDWMRAWCGMPESTGGVLVSGGSQANLTALATARHVKLRNEVSRGVAYGSDQCHSSLLRGFRVLGFSQDQFVRLPSDEHFRLPVEALRARVAEDRARGLHPFCVVANAGTTNTGAVDPLDELADFCQQEGLWLHADGAYGAAAVLSPAGREALRGIERVDSLTIDPHKWLFQPYECGCVLVRDWQHLFGAFQVTAEYLADALRISEDVNFQDLGIQLTRSFRALKLWMSIRFFGLAAFREAITRGIELAQQAEQIVRETQGLHLFTPAQLGILTFYYAEPEHDLAAANELNQRIVNRVLDEAFATVTSTMLRDRRVLRMCIINPRTTVDDLRQTVARLAQFGREESQRTRGADSSSSLHSASFQRLSLDDDTSCWTERQVGGTFERFASPAGCGIASIHGRCYLAIAVSAAVRGLPRARDRAPCHVPPEGVWQFAAPCQGACLGRPIVYKGRLTLGRGVYESPRLQTFVQAQWFLVLSGACVVECRSDVALAFQRATKHQESTQWPRKRS